MDWNNSSSSSPSKGGCEWKNIILRVFHPLSFWLNKWLQLRNRVCLEHVLHPPYSTGEFNNISLGNPPDQLKWRRRQRTGHRCDKTGCSRRRNIMWEKNWTLGTTNAWKREKTTRKDGKCEQMRSSARRCRANEVDDPAFLPPHWVVIISNHKVGVLTVHKMNYSSFSLHRPLLLEITCLRHAPFTWFYTSQDR